MYLSSTYTRICLFMIWRENIILVTHITLPHQDILEDFFLTNLTIWATVTPRSKRNWMMLPSVSDKRSKHKGCTAARNSLEVFGKSCNWGETNFPCQSLKSGKTLAISFASGKGDLIKMRRRSRQPCSSQRISGLIHSPSFFHAENKARARASGSSTGGQSQPTTNKTLQALRHATMGASKSLQCNALLRSRRGLNVTDLSASWCQSTSKWSKICGSRPSLRSLSSTLAHCRRYQVQKDVAQWIPEAYWPTSAMVFLSSLRTWGCSRSTLLTSATCFNTTSKGKCWTTSQSSSLWQQTKLSPQSGEEEKHRTSWIDRPSYCIHWFSLHYWCNEPTEQSIIMVSWECFPPSTCLKYLFNKKNITTSDIRTFFHMPHLSICCQGQWTSIQVFCKFPVLTHPSSVTQSEDQHLRVTKLVELHWQASQPGPLRGVKQLKSEGNAKNMVQVQGWRFERKLLEIW